MGQLSLQNNSKVHLLNFSSILNIVAQLINSIPIGTNENRDCDSQDTFQLLTPTHLAGLSRNQIPDFSGDSELNKIYKKLLGDKEALLKILLENQIMVCKTNIGSHTKDRKMDTLAPGDICCFFHTPEPNLQWKIGIIHEICRALGSDSVSKARVLYMINGTKRSCIRASDHLIKLKPISVQSLREELCQNTFNNF